MSIVPPVIWNVMELLYVSKARMPWAGLAENAVAGDDRPGLRAQGPVTERAAPVTLANVLSPQPASLSP